VTIAEGIAIAAAGMAAGTINTVVGSGTLITFPTLLALGYPPLTANVSNNVGLFPGGLSGVHGYREELEGQHKRALRLGTASLVGGVSGAIALLTLPPGAFKAIVPVFIAIALVFVVLQPRISARLADRPRPPAGHEGAPILAAVYVTGAYGGYFGAAQGIILLAFLGAFIPEPLQRVNGLKNVLATIVNGVAALVFILVAHIDWGAAALIAAGSIVGAQIGARYGRRLHPAALRALIVLVGLTALVRLLPF
jgi:uncharacterized membrane protein YfcA